jgi:hypothetical protein
MSISPIGTIVHTLSPNSIIRAGIPLLDNFNATDVSVSVESLLALVPAGGGGVQSVTGSEVDNSIPFNPVITSVLESGTWTPTITTQYSKATLSKAFYTRVNNSVSFYIEFTLENALSILAGDTFFTPPNELVPSFEMGGMMAFRTNASFSNRNIDSFVVASNGVDIGFSMINEASAPVYLIFIQGTYLLA